MLNLATLQFPQVPGASNAISEVSNVQSTEPTSMFGEMLSQAVGKVANQQSQSQHLVEEHLLGHSVTDIEVLTTMKQAELTLKTMIQVRNKAVEAYKELKQIQL